MVAYFTEQLVKVILFMTLAVVICFCSEMVKEGTDMYKVKQTKMRFAFFNSDRMNVCSCLIFKLGCQHCPENLFCNTQNSACCPISNSDNDCHNYCVPPGHTCCKKKKGACKDDVPTCCGNYCCGKNEKCCGEKCCSAGTKCCNNLAHKNFCIWKNTPSQVNTSPGYYSQKDNCVTQFQDTDIRYFSEICQIFAKGTRLQHIDKGFNQFAVLTLNQLSQNRNAEKSVSSVSHYFRYQTSNTKLCICDSKNNS
ncbi:unnamed protein product [Mytilus edulis]|uniref:Uncharacterized protein n=1 Tax=Mytilus edulis TaxID=6550 RepID=A0A8S3R9H6_MYTED|nr:unnamed protein product [Mytilus edulis]